MNLTIFVCELIGTALLILLGDGVVANVTLDKSGMKGAGPIQITLAWGLAVLLPCFIFGRACGAHLNPALTLALAVDGSVPWTAVPSYISAQFLGAFLGAILVYVLFKKQFDASPEIARQRGCFCTAPSVPNTGLNILSETVGTFVLVFAIKGLGQVVGAGESGVNPLLVFGIIVSIGMSLGGLTGYAINPARDLGPRVAYAVLPFKEKDPNWGYSWIPVVGPIIGAVLAALVYQALLGLPGFAL